MLYGLFRQIAEYSNNNLVRNVDYLLAQNKRRAENIQWVGANKNDLTWQCLSWCIEFNLDYHVNNLRNCLLLSLSNEICKIIIDFLYVIDLANLRCVCKHLREITSLNEKIMSYLVFSKNVYDLDFNQHFNTFLIGWILILVYPTCYISDIKFFLCLNVFFPH